MGDMQVNAEYVAYNLHYLSQLSGGMQTAVVSHSQGGPNTQWALQFWPSTRNVTRAFVAISPDFAGIDLLGSSSLLNDICADGLCQASLWQQSARSKYYQALHNQDFKALVPTTSIWTQVRLSLLPSFVGKAELIFIVRWRRCPTAEQRPAPWRHGGLCTKPLPTSTRHTRNHDHLRCFLCFGFGCSEQQGCRQSGSREEECLQHMLASDCEGNES